MHNKLENYGENYCIRINNKPEYSIKSIVWYSFKHGTVYILHNRFCEPKKWLVIINTYIRNKDGFLYNPIS